MGARTIMKKVEEIKKAVTYLSPEDLTGFYNWLNEFLAKKWDLEFENDVKSKKLDSIAREALEDFRLGKCKKL